MIDEEATFKWKTYYSTDLKPHSRKKVCAVCDKCGKVRWIAFGQYKELCFTCAHKKRYKYHHGKKIVRNIDEDKTFQEMGYRSRDLSVGSNKKVLAICTECGMERWIKFRNYHDLCRKCAFRTDERCKKLSDANKGKHVSDETKKKMRENHADISGEKHHNWKGGSSFEPYCHKFNEAFKESIRDKFGRKCFMCDRTEEENRRKLSVHHVSYDKECMCNNIECEFVPLCMRCHIKTNDDRDLWERLIMNVLDYEEWINIRTNINTYKGDILRHFSNTVI